MKKIKIMLTAVVVFAVVGGALAFKAKKVSGTFYTVLSSNGKCTVPTDEIFITNDDKQPSMFIHPNDTEQCLETYTTVVQ
jgi:hypothetical protein